MENNIEKVEWVQALFLNELMQYLKMCDLKELSLTNNYLRNKLNPLIFKSICLNGENLSSYFNYSSTNENLKNDVKMITKHCKNSYYNSYLNSLGLEHEPIIKLLETSLLPFKKYVKDFKFYKLREFSCFAFHLSYKFENLENLEIRICYIPLIKLVKLGENLKNLKKLTLYQVNLESDKEELSIDIVNFPANLKKLSISRSYVYNYNISRSGYGTTNRIHRHTDYQAPYAMHIPSLYTFNFGNDDRDLQLIRFLKLNRQLKSLGLGTGRINQDLLNYIASGSSNLTKLTIKRYIFHVNGLSVPTFNFITDLILGQFHLNHTLGASICLNCPNLINLTITLTHGDIINQFNIMLEYLAKSFKSLKKFELIVVGGYVFSLKFHYLTTIQTLILRNYHRWTIDLMAKYFPPQFRNTRDIHIPSGEVVVLNK